LHDILSAGKHLLGLINDILDFSKAQSGKMQLSSEVIDLRAPVTEAAEMMDAAAKKKGVALTVAREQPALASVDRRRLKQVALNLLSNAVKFTPRGGSVSVAVRESGGFAELEVKDTGIGIAPEHHSVVFEAFRQVDSSPRRQ